MVGFIKLFSCIIKTSEFEPKTLRPVQLMELDKMNWVLLYILLLVVKHSKASYSLQIKLFLNIFVGIFVILKVTCNNPSLCYKSTSLFSRYLSYAF